MVIRFSKSIMEDILEDFTRLTVECLYNKMPYQEWKNLKKLISENRFIYFYPCEDLQAKQFMLASEKYHATQEGWHPHYYYYINDNSFGQFFYVHGDSYPVSAIKWDDGTIEKFNDEISYEDILLGRAEDDMIKNDRWGSDMSISTSQDYSNATITWSGDPYSISTAYSDGSWRTVATTDALATKADKVEVTSLSVEIDNMTKSIEDLRNKFEEFNTAAKEKEKEKENDNMSNSVFKFDFGPVNDTGRVSVSMYGLAVRNRAGGWVSYDKSSGNIMNVDVVNSVNLIKYLYKVPVAIKDIRPGDTVVHLGIPVFVKKVLETGSMLVVDVCDGEEKVIMPIASPFGFNFYTKIISLMDFSAPATADNPFGNMWMLMMMGDNGIDPMMLMMMNGGKMDMSNPMMMYMLMKDGNTNDMLPLMLMMNNK